MKKREGMRRLAATLCAAVDDKRYDVTTCSSDDDVY